MKYLTLMILIASCGKSPQFLPKSVFWQSQRGNTVEKNGDVIIYRNKNCAAEGNYTKTYDNYLTWDLDKNDCWALQGEVTCYWAQNSYGEQANFVCKDLEFKETFYRMGHE